MTSTTLGRIASLDPAANTTKALPRLVVVDDHAVVRQLVGPRISTEVGMTLAAEASTVKEATAVCLRERPDLVVVDWGLPDGSGAQVMLHVAPKLPRARWLFVSGHEYAGMVEEAASLGANGFVLKKCPLDVLCAAATKILKGETYYCADCTRLLIEGMRCEGLAALHLTPREREILRDFAGGESIESIALRLKVAAKTISNTLSHLVEKLGLDDRVGLIRYARKHGLGDSV